MAADSPAGPAPMTTRSIRLLAKTALLTFVRATLLITEQLISGTAQKNLERTLQFKPNPFMDTSKFIYRIDLAAVVVHDGPVPLDDFDGAHGVLLSLESFVSG